MGSLGGCSAALVAQATRPRRAPARGKLCAMDRLQLVLGPVDAASSCAAVEGRRRKSIGSLRRPSTRVPGEDGGVTLCHAVPCVEICYLH